MSKQFNNSPKANDIQWTTLQNWEKQQILTIREAGSRKGWS